MGTEPWCSRHYADEQYAGQDCFVARYQDWQYPSSLNCSQGFESCEGTEAICGKIESSTRRTRCLTTQNKGQWLSPLSPGCADPTSTTDERCVGTERWCKMQDIIDIYGSTEACSEGRRQPRPSNDNYQPSFLPQNREKCSNGQTEECRGTENFCALITDKNERLGCFESRRHGLLPFAVVFSPGCDEEKSEHGGEVCIGTVGWCKKPEQVEIYGSEKNCLSFRDETPELSRWIYMANNCSDAEERCFGTESVCSWGTHPSVTKDSSLRKACFATRQPPAFLFPNSPGCPRPSIMDERCMGTYKWCHAFITVFGYEDKYECLDMRWAGLRSFDEKILEDLISPIRDAILDAGRSVTRNAVFREVILNREDGNFAREAAKNDIYQFLDDLDKTVGSLSDKVIGGVLSKYSGS